jgi:hypothetical protein
MHDNEAHSIVRALEDIAKSLKETNAHLSAIEHLIATMEST